MEETIIIYDRNVGGLRQVPLTLGNPYIGEEDCEDNDRNLAIILLQKHVGTKDLATAGHRNDDAVNICIALRVLGLDPENWIMDLCKEAGIKDPDMALWLEHVERVLPYLRDWGPEGERERALDYAIV